MQRFLGCLNYVNPFIKNLADLIKPLQQKLKKGVTWTWTNNDQEHVQHIRQQLPRLTLPRTGEPLIIESDASETAWGAILKVKRDFEEICRYASGTFSKSQQNYHINEKELLAIKKAIEKFEIYLGEKFVVRTDNKSAISFIKGSITDLLPNKQRIRWQTWFSQYHFDIEHIKGTQKNLADILSRTNPD